MHKPTVTLCMIVKNEEKNLPGCLESVGGLVDEIVLVDTGSEDGTVRVAESFGARVVSIAWPGDFSAARNVSLDHAHGDWILYLDADERLEPNGHPDCLREAASNEMIDAWSVYIRNYKYEATAFDTSLNIRFFRKLPEVRFENEVHERVEPALARIGAKVAIAPFAIDHFGYGVKPDLMREKLQRNLLLSRKQLERAPEDPYCLYFLGATLLLLEENRESREFFMRALATENIPQVLRALVYNLLSYLSLRENNPDEALALAEKSVLLAPRQNTSYLLAGLAQFTKNDYRAALPLLTRAYEFLQLPPQKRHTVLSQEYAFVDEHELNKLLGICLSETDRMDESVSHLRRYFDLGGRNPEIIKRLGILCVNSGDYESGLGYLQKAEELGTPICEIALPKAMACLKLKDYRCAAALLDEAEKHQSADSEKLHLLRHMLQGECNDACAPDPIPADPVPVDPVPDISRPLTGCALFRMQAYEEALPVLLESYRSVLLASKEHGSDFLLEEDIQKEDLIEMIGVCFAQTGKYAEAIPFLKLAARMKDDPSISERAGICLLNAGDYPGAREYLEKARAGGIPFDSLALPLSFTCLRTGDFERAGEYFRNALPRDENAIAVAFQLIQAMADEDGFRPYLSDCLMSKLDAFRSTFPNELQRFLTDIPPVTPAQAIQG